MNSNEKDNTNSSCLSSLLDFVEKAKKECASLEKSVQELESYRVNTLESRTGEAESQGAVVEKKYSAKQGDVQRLNARVTQVQNRIRGFNKKQDVLSSRVASLTNKIIADKEAQLATVNETEAELLTLQEAAAKPFSSMKAQQMLVSLTEEEHILEAAVAEKEGLFTEYENKLQNLGGQLPHKGILLADDERSIAMSLFQQEKAAILRMLKTVSSKGESLRQEISRLSKKA